MRFIVRWSFGLVVVGGVWLVPGAAPTAWAQISPGKLARPHRALEGSLKCVQCHSQRAEEMDQKCLACHQEIATLRDRKRGLHSRVGNRPCAACHPDHAGLDFEMVHWEEGSPEGFDHLRAGWKLEGKHASLECRKCHTASFQDAAFMKGMKREHSEESWLGLDPSCAGCHEDAHAGSLGTHCSGCHGAEAWKPAPGFDHAKTSFPLTGRHESLDCAPCHSAPGLDLALDAKGKRIPRYKPLPHGECSACHADPHANRFGPECKSCHVTSGFHTISNTFDHSRTRYPLLGKHAVLACASCHDEKKTWGKKPPFEACGSCHADPHGGRATLAGAPVDCASCHAVQGFAPSSFPRADHDRTRFPLAGEHAEVPCAKCHERVQDAEWGTSGVVMRPVSERCEDCHAKPHGSQLAASQACETCHDPRGFAPSTYSAIEHAATRLSLEGRHEELACRACHGSARPGLPPSPGVDVTGNAGIWLRADPACAACHMDPHAGRFSQEAAKECAACHAFGSFVPSTIDAGAHSGFGFALGGAHGAVPCVVCHSEMSYVVSDSTLLVGGRVSALPFAPRDHACVDCHEDPHGGQFATRLAAGGCGDCHGVESFSPAAAFDHTKDAAFVLDGAHARVACARCHPTREDGVVVYTPIETACASCHRPGEVADPGKGGKPQ